MFREEAEKMREIYRNRAKESQEQVDEFIRHAMPYLKGLVDWYNKNQEAEFALANLNCKLNACEEECND